MGREQSERQRQNRSEPTYDASNKAKMMKTASTPRLGASRTRVVTSAKRSGRKAAKKTGGSDKGVFDLDIGGFFAPDTYYDNAKSGSKALGAQKAVGYSFSGAQGSAPDIDAQGKKARLGGRVYQFADKYGGNIDEYSPIWAPETRQPGSDDYEPGLAGLAVWFIGFAGLLATGGFAIYTTSALAN